MQIKQIQQFYYIFEERIVFLMYNYFKYQQTVRLEEAQRREEEKYSKWLLRNQDFKEQAKQKQKVKLQKWVSSQLKQPVKLHVEDDHYKQWRFLKQFRDVQLQPNFQGSSHDMDKYFTERQRKQIEHLSRNKQSLIDSSLIHEFQRSRSLRSQGPLNPKIQFRSTKKDLDYLNPRMRFHNVTDKQRLNQIKITFDDKLKSLYSSFEMKRSKIGKPRVSFYGQANLNSMQRSKSTRERYDVDQEAQKSYKLNNSANNKANFQFKLLENQQNLAQSKHFSNRKLTERMPQINSNRKTYFKLAKTMQLQGQKNIKALLLQTQYDRKKDLSNLKMNMTCENYQKRPIL